MPALRNQFGFIDGERFSAKPGTFLARPSPPKSVYIERITRQRVPENGMPAM
jgi:hypothetical protein